MKPTRSRPGASPLLPAERALLCRGKPAIEGGIHLAGIVNFIEPGLDQIVPMPFNEHRQRPRIKPASRNTQSRGELLRRVEHVVRNRDGRFHALSITPVIPTFLAYESVDSRPTNDDPTGFAACSGQFAVAANWRLAAANWA